MIHKTRKLVVNVFLRQRKELVW